MTFLEACQQLPPLFRAEQLARATGYTRSAAHQWLFRARDRGEVVRVAFGLYRLALDPTGPAEGDTVFMFDRRCRVVGVDGHRVTVEPVEGDWS